MAFNPAVPGRALQPAAIPARDGDSLEEWFDRELRPALLQLLGQDRRQAETERENTFRALRHWLTELPGRAAQQGAETHAFVTAIAGEVRGLLGDA